MRSLRAAVVFSGAGYSWDRSPQLRSRLLAAMAHMGVPVFFLHAANDYSVAAGKTLDARLRQLGKPHRLKIHPPIGHTVDEEHDFPYLGLSSWERQEVIAWPPLLAWARHMSVGATNRTWPDGRVGT